jgi:polar amino acid transport system substrate-binding protein
VRSIAAAILAVLALTFAAASATADAPPTLQPGVLTVGLNMPTPGFEVGAVRGHSVLFARGFEIDLARAIAAKLGIPKVAFYQEPQFPRLIAGGPKPWDIALGEVTITDERAQRLTFSVPYLDADEGVLLRRGLTPTPRTLAQLAGLRLCTQAATTAVDVIATRVMPTTPPRLFGNVTLLLNALQTNRCDAVVYDAPILATLRAQVPQRFGPLAGVIATGEQYGVVMAKGSPLEAAVDQAVGDLIAQGRIATLMKRWLSTDLSTLPVLS